MSNANTAAATVYYAEIVSMLGTAEAARFVMLDGVSINNGLVTYTYTAALAAYEAGPATYAAVCRLAA